MIKYRICLEGRTKDVLTGIKKKIEKSRMVLNILAQTICLGENFRSNLDRLSENAYEAFAWKC